MITFSLLCQIWFQILKNRDITVGIEVNSVHADFPAQALEKGSTVFILSDEGRPVGLLETEPGTIGEKPRCIVIGTLVILPECRRHGLGKMLMSVAAGAAVERKIWFLAAKIPDTPEAQGFAAAIHMKQTVWFTDSAVLDLSDVEGMRHG